MLGKEEEEEEEEDGGCQPTTTTLFCHLLLKTTWPNFPIQFQI
jgi:hypothetical protein